MKAKEATIFKGQFYPAGKELPKDYEELSKGKTSLGGPAGSYANQVSALQQHQTMRPGMSGSGKEQEEDIVDDQGHVTKPGVQAQEAKGKAPASSEEPKK